MKRQKVLIVSLVVVIIFFGANILKAAELLFSIKGGYVNGLKISETDYGAQFMFDYVEKGIISNSIERYGISGEVSYFINDTIGLSFSWDYLNHTVDLYSESLISISIIPVVNYSRELQWNDSGKISIIPLNFNFVVRKNIKNGLSFYIFGGPSLFLFEKLNLPSHIGLGGLSIQYYLNEKMEVIRIEYIPDSFDLPVAINKDRTYLLGANWGIELEQKVYSKISICGGIKYFLAPKKEYKWELIYQKNYHGLEGNLMLCCSPDIHSKGEITSTINASSYIVFLGIKVHL